MFGLRSYRAWTFGTFLLVLLQPAVLYLLAALVLPADLGTEAALDLRANYYRQAPWFFGLAVLLLVQSLARDLVLRGALPDPVNVLAHLAFLLLWAGAAVTRWDAFHRFTAACTGALCTVYIAVLFARLP